MRNSAILVFANKQDMKNCMSAAEVAEALGMYTREGSSLARAVRRGHAGTRPVRGVGLAQQHAQEPAQPGWRRAWERAGRGAPTLKVTRRACVEPSRHERTETLPINDAKDLTVSLAAADRVVVFVTRHLLNHDVTVIHDIVDVALDVTPAPFPSRPDPFHPTVSFSPPATAPLVTRAPGARARDRGAAWTTSSSLAS